MTIQKNDIQKELRKLWDNIHKPFKECKKPICNIDDFEQQILDLFKRMAHEGIPINHIDSDHDGYFQVKAYLLTAHQNIEEKFR